MSQNKQRDRMISPTSIPSSTTASRLTSDVRRPTTAGGNAATSASVTGKTNTPPRPPAGGALTSSRMQTSINSATATTTSPATFGSPLSSLSPYGIRHGMLTTHNKNQFFATSPAIVFDFGSRFVKAGYAGETTPRCVLPAKALLRVDNNNDAASYEEERSLYDSSNSTAERRRILELIIRRLIVNHLLSSLSTNQRRIVVVESPLTPTSYRCDIAHVLFEIFKVISIMFIPSNIAALMCIAETTGLVVDLGNRRVTIIPTVHGATIQQAWRVRRAGSAEHMRQFLLRNFPEVACAHDNYDNRPFDAAQQNFRDVHAFLDDMLARVCFATSPARARMIRSGAEYTSNTQAGTVVDDDDDDNDDDDGESVKMSFPPPKGAKFTCRGQEIHVQGRLFEQCLEQLFGPDEHDDITLAELILQSIAACPIDCRRQLAKSIVLTGGIAHLPNVQHRLALDLRNTIRHNSTYTRLFGNMLQDFAFVILPCLPNCAAWLGGSIAAYSDYINQRSITRQMYLQKLLKKKNNDDDDEEEEIVLPDWSEFEFSELRTPFVPEEAAESANNTGTIGVAAGFAAANLKFSQRFSAAAAATSPGGTVVSGMPSSEISPVRHHAGSNSRITAAISKM